MIFTRLWSLKENVKERLRAKGDIPGYLVVIAVMAIIAALLLPLMNGQVSTWITNQFTQSNAGILTYGVQ